MHWRQMMEAKYFGAWDLMKEDGSWRDTVVTIARVEKAEIVSQSGKSKKPAMWFQGQERPLVANVTNCKAIARMYGNDPREWVGKQITLYVGEANNQGETVPAIRVRPTPPAKQQASRATATANRQPGDEG